jgi:hypothetical protein
MTVMGVFGVIAASGLPHFDARRQDINNITNTIIGDLRAARARSITTGTHFAFRLLEDGGYQLERLIEDDGEWVEDSVAKTVTLPPHVQVTIEEDVDLVEFNTRGMMVSTDGPFSVIVEDTLHEAAHVILIWPSGQVYRES